MTSVLSMHPKTITRWQALKRASIRPYPMPTPDPKFHRYDYGKYLKWVWER